MQGSVHACVHCFQHYVKKYAMLHHALSATTCEAEDSWASVGSPAVSTKQLAWNASQDQLRPQGSVADVITLTVNASHSWKTRPEVPAPHRGFCQWVRQCISRKKETTMQRGLLGRSQHEAQHAYNRHQSPCPQMINTSLLCGLRTRVRHTCYLPSTCLWLRVDIKQPAIIML